MDDTEKNSNQILNVKNKTCLKMSMMPIDETTIDLVSFYLVEAKPEIGASIISLDGYIGGVHQRTRNVGY